MKPACLHLYLRFLVLILLFLFPAGHHLLHPAQTAEEIIEKVDGCRKLSESFTLKVKISDYKEDQLKDEAVFMGHFEGNEKSLLICTKGKNKRMKVLMKGDNMWVSLAGSRRALRITPMQRLMGQASNGDVAKTAFSIDYAPELVENSREQNIIKIRLKAKRKGATYQQVMLYIDNRHYRPIKAEFFLLSGKHCKTAFYEDFMTINQHLVVHKIRLRDAIKKERYTIMEYLDYKQAQVPEKYFNVMYLPKLELDPE
jgi:outer membrane lipoprotein-sorting protein